MSEADREEFLDAFEEEGEHTLVGFCVMGGIFSEGIDLTGKRLIGAAVVGTGLPQVGSEREILKEYYDKKEQMGFDYAYAFANAKIALFDSVQGAEIEFASEHNADKAKLAAKYADENSDPIHAAKNGYIDNIIEPKFVRQYLIASLQMLLK